MGAVTVGILAAGKGVRMRSNLPKVLHPVCGRPVVEHVVRAALDLDPENVAVVVGPDSESVRDALSGLSPVSFAVQAEPLGTGDALRALFEGAKISDTLLLLPGDTPLLKADVLQTLLEHHEASAAALSVLTFAPSDPDRYGRVIRNPEGGVERIVEALDASAEELASREVNTGIYAMKADPIRELTATLTADNKQGEIYITDLVQAARNAGLSVSAVRAPDPDDFIGINTRGHLARAGAVMRRRLLDRLMEGGVTVVDPESTYVEWDVEVGADTVILPFSVLSRGVRVGPGCRVGPFAHLRAGTVLEAGVTVGSFTEIKASRLGPGSRALHLSYLGDTEVGAHVNVGAGTVTANFDGKEKHATVLGDGVQTGCNTVFVAPVTVGAGARTGAGAVVIRDVPKGATVVGVPARESAPSNPRGGDHD